MNVKMTNRLPVEFFATRGVGDSDNEIHAGSYHIALHQAGISDYNIMTYSSVLPANAYYISKELAKKPPFGSELMTIMSVAHGEKDDIISAGIIYGWLYDDDNKKIGGLVCEVAGKMDENSLVFKLNAAINELHDRTYSQYHLRDITQMTKMHRVRRKYGTCLCALCFTEFE